MAFRPFRQILISIWEVVEVVLVAVVTVFFIRTFLLQPFLVSGASMEPNFRDGDYLFVDRLTYRLREPARGEVVVFRYPEQPSTFFIKRIIGLPGETVELRDGMVRIRRGSDEIMLEEPYVRDGERSSSTLTVTLEGGEYFVLGDNRDWSFDSRNWGSLMREGVIGIVRVRLFPFTAFGAVRPPSYER